MEEEEEAEGGAAEVLVSAGVAGVQGCSAAWMEGRGGARGVSLLEWFTGGRGSSQSTPPAEPLSPSSLGGNINAEPTALR